MARHKDAEFSLPAEGNGKGLEWHHVRLAVLMDIRDELKRLNQLLHCSNFVAIPHTLAAIRRNTTKKKRKAARV